MALSSRLPKHEYINARFDRRKTHYPPLHNMLCVWKDANLKDFERCRVNRVLNVSFCTCKHTMKEGNDEVHSLNKIFSCIYSFEKGNAGFHEKNP